MRYCVNCIAYVSRNPCDDCGRRTLPVMEPRDASGRSVAEPQIEADERPDGPWSLNGWRDA